MIPSKCGNKVILYCLTHGCQSSHNSHLQPSQFPLQCLLHSDATTLAKFIRTLRQLHANTGRLSRYGMVPCCSHRFNDTQQESLKLSALAELHTLRAGWPGAKTCPLRYMQRRQCVPFTQDYSKPISDELGRHRHCPQSLCSNMAPAKRCPGVPERSDRKPSADAQQLTFDAL